MMRQKKIPISAPEPETELARVRNIIRKIGKIVSSEKPLKSLDRRLIQALCLSALYKDMFAEIIIGDE